MRSRIERQEDRRWVLVIAASVLAIGGLVTVNVIPASSPEDVPRVVDVAAAARPGVPAPIVGPEIASAVPTSSPEETTTDDFPDDAGALVWPAVPLTGHPSVRTTPRGSPTGRTSARSLPAPVRTPTSPVTTTKRPTATVTTTRPSTSSTSPTKTSTATTTSTTSSTSPTSTTEETTDPTTSSTSATRTIIGDPRDVTGFDGE